MLGRSRESREDYQTAQRKIREYSAANATNAGSFADTTKKYSSLLALDADFAKKDFDNELLQHRDIDIRLKPLYRFALTASRENTSYALQHRYENALLDKFINDSPVPMTITNEDKGPVSAIQGRLENALYGDSSAGAGSIRLSQARIEFIRGLYAVQDKQFNAALGVEWTRADYRKLYAGEATDDPRVLKVNAVLQRTMTDMAREIRRTIDAVDPAMRCGLCACWPGWWQLDEVVHALAGPNTRPFLRLNGACYGDVKAETKKGLAAFEDMDD